MKQKLYRPCPIQPFKNPLVPLNLPPPSSSSKSRQLVMSQKVAQYSDMYDKREKLIEKNSNQYLTTTTGMKVWIASYLKQVLKPQ